MAGDPYENESSDPIENNQLRCTISNSLFRHLDYARSTEIPEQLETGHTTAKKRS
jgi:hypothetical protein